MQELPALLKTRWGNAAGPSRRWQARHELHPHRQGTADVGAEYIVAHGNPQVMAVRAGGNPHLRDCINSPQHPRHRSGPLAALNELTHLPVILDPSHATGKRSLVPALARAGVAIGADGLIVEMHPHPEKAVSDGAQSLDPKQFERMMEDLKPYIKLWKAARVAETAAAV